MLRLTKYLKPYLLLILIAVVLLFVQANADLALPDYMSNIVNYGIQQGGVVNAVPMAIRQSEMNRLVTFMTADNKNAVLADYTLVDNNSAEYAADVKLYPDLAKEPVYVLKNIDQAEITRLNPIMGKALLVVSGIEQALANPAAAQAMGKSFGFDLSKIPPGTDVFALLAKLPAATLTQMTATIDQKFATLGNSMIVQMSVGCQNRVCRPGDEYQPDSDELHPAYRHADAAGDPAFGALHHRGRLPVCPHCRRPGA
jgi:ATP-binding cassette subfamily B protein